MASKRRKRYFNKYFFDVSSCRYLWKVAHAALILLLPEASANSKKSPGRVQGKTTMQETESHHTSATNFRGTLATIRLAQGHTCAWGAANNALPTTTVAASKVCYDYLTQTLPWPPLLRILYRYSHSGCCSFQILTHIQKSWYKHGVPCSQA